MIKCTIYIFKLQLHIYIIKIEFNYSLQFVKIMIEEIKDDVEELDERVTKTEVKVKVIKKTVKRHDEEIKDTKVALDEANTRVDVVKEEIVETKELMEEIDEKVAWMFLCFFRPLSFNFPIMLQILYFGFH